MMPWLMIMQEEVFVGATEDDVGVGLYRVIYSFSFGRFSVVMKNPAGLKKVEARKI